MVTSTHWLLLVLCVNFALGLIFQITRDYLRARRTRTRRGSTTQDQ